MKKQQELSGSSALDFVESLENCKMSLESFCEGRWQLAVKYGMNAYYIGEVKSSLQNYVDAARQRVSMDTASAVSTEAWYIAMAKFAERLADRYGEELN